MYNFAVLVVSCNLQCHYNCNPAVEKLITAISWLQDPLVELMDQLGVGKGVGLVWSGPNERIKRIKPKG